LAAKGSLVNGGGKVVNVVKWMKKKKKRKRKRKRS
jgi:hypothetical protein